jgi:hypothetical protein
MVTVYTIHGTNIPHISFHTFRPDGAIFRYTRVLQSPVSLYATFPHTGQCLHIGSALYVWSFYAIFVVKYEGGSINKVTSPLIAYIYSNNIYTYNQ